jgi:hypothetical protein
MTSDKLFEALENHLRRDRDPELLLLKGHLILEQCLNELLRTYVPKLDALDKMNLTFARKLDLLVALGHRLYAPSHDGDSKIRELNRIRNKLAHRLDFADYEDDLKKWACSVVGYVPRSMNRRATCANTIRKAFYLLAAYLAGVTRTKQELKR